MKKVLVFLAVLALAAPVFAQAEPNVYITCSDNTDGTSTISYDATDAGVVRAFSMDLTVDAGAKITAISGYDAEGAGAGTTIPIGYSIYMSSIDFGTDPNNVDAWGDPVASGVDALGGLDTSGITVELGSLYDMDAEPPDTPPLTGDLFKITVDQGCNLTIEDTVQKSTRGGIVLEDGSGANLVSSGCAIGPGECLKDMGDVEYDNWVLFGKPDCWCYQRQCRGDINDTKTGPRIVQALDRGLFRAAFLQTDAEMFLHPEYTCADLNHVKTGPRWVQALDRGIFRTYFLQLDGLVPCCNLAEDTTPIGTDCPLTPADKFNFWTHHTP
jgi:hypothetical protein